MTGLGRSLCALTLAVVFAATVAASDASPTNPATAPSAPTPEQLVKDLGSPVFILREKATKALWQLGEKARPALEAAAKGTDAEVAQRAREVLDKFDAGIFADTPPAVLREIREFRSGLLEKQHSAVVALASLGDAGVQALRLLLTKETHPESRDGLFETLAVVLRAEVPKLIAAGQLDRAEAALALNTLGPSDAGLMDYALFVHLRGRSSSATSELERTSREPSPAGRAAAKALVFILRAAGERDRAKAAAAALAKADVTFHPTYESLLEDLGAWNELADRIGDRVNSRDGLRMFRLRMAGRTKEADELAASQKGDFAADVAPVSGVDSATLALLLNDRPLDGIDRLRAHHNAPHILADALAARMEFNEALGLVAGSPKAAEAFGDDLAALRQLYATRRGRLLWQLGKRDAAAQVFTQAFEQVRDVVDATSPALTQLVGAEVRAGRIDLACEHFGAALVPKDPGQFRPMPSSRQDAFEVLFERDADAAQYWWAVLRGRKTTEAPGATMKRVRALLTGTAPADELDAAVKLARGKESIEGSLDAERKALAVAAALRAAGRVKEAAAELAELADDIRRPDRGGHYFRRDEEQDARRYGRGSRSWVFGTDERFRFWVELADLLGELGRHREAADYLGFGTKYFPDNPVLYFLSGKALVKAGDEQEGRRWVDLSHWVSLGNARMRGRFLEELVTRGYAADARRERELVYDTGWVSELNIGNVWNQVGRASVLLKDYDAAAAANRRAIHYLLRTPGVTYVEGHAYLTVPQSVRAFEARGLLAAGKVEEAVARAKQCLAVMPGNSDLVIGMVPELDKRGRSKEADELFRLAWDAYGRVIRDNPESAWARYSAAWLAAGCRRELDKATELAAKAAELEPGTRSYREAVAEVSFRRGDREKAVALMTELAAADRRSFHYKRQLERYKTADAASPLPEGSDD